MIDSLKPYPAMRDSGVPWLGEVPEHWGVGTLRRKLRSYDGIKIGPFGSQLKLEQMVESGFKVYGQANVIARDFARGRKFIDQGKFDELSACAVRAGDLVVTMMGTSGRCAKVPDDAVPGIMDSHLIRLRTTLDINRTFASRVIDEAPYIKEQIEVVGKGSIMHGLNSGMIKDLLLALPPLPEQAAIVRFLDYADRRIRRYIRAKQKLIKLLEEQKQAIIHRAITRGIDPNVRLKPSGVEWLGDVPEHWTIRLLGRCLERIDQGWSPVAAEGELVPEQWAVLTLSSVKRGVFDPTAVKPVPVTARVPSGIEVTNGDVLLTRSNTRELVGDVCLAKAVRPRTVICDLIYRLVPDAGALNSTFLMLQLLSRFGRSQIERDARGSSGTMPKIAQRHIRSWQFLVPPLAEQESIATAMTEAIACADASITRIHAEIFLLREYRTRLIADVVTGKLDVREVAARLPDEVEEPEPVDEIESEGDTDEAGADDADEVREEAEV